MWTYLNFLLLASHMHMQHFVLCFYRSIPTAKLVYYLTCIHISDTLKFKLTIKNVQNIKNHLPEILVHGSNLSSGIPNRPTLAFQLKYAVSFPHYAGKFPYYAGIMLMISSPYYLTIMLE